MTAVKWTGTITDERYKKNIKTFCKTLPEAGRNGRFSEKSFSILHLEILLCENKALDGVIIGKYQEQIIERMKNGGRIVMLITGGEVYLDGSFCFRDIQIEHGKIMRFAVPGTLVPEQEEEVFRAKGKRILPGLVDIHTHGRAGEDFSLATEESLKRLCLSYASCGVTAVLATIMTNEPYKIEVAAEQVGAYRKKERMESGRSNFVEREVLKNSRKFTGAKLLGIHLEGPFLGKEKKGAHAEKYLMEPDQAWFQKLQRLSDNSIRLVTLDPSLSGAEEFIRNCRREQVAVSLGHTACDYKTAMTAAEAGADHVTHLFNAMALLHHREPGLIGAALDSGMYLELICDGVHLHPSLVRLLFAAHPEKVLLISDSMSAAGSSDGIYELGGLKVHVTEGKAVQADGTIAGSTISVFEAMVNCIRFGIPAEAAVYSATYLPAKSIGMEQQTGSLVAGRAADFLVVSENWELEQVYINGERVLV